MKKQRINILLFGLLTLVLLSETSCKKDYNNPSAVPIEDAFGSARAMTGVVVGLQLRCLRGF